MIVSMKTCTIRNAADMAAAIRNSYEPGEISSKEHVKLLMLDWDFHLLGCAHIGTGDRNTCLVDNRVIAQAVIGSDARLVVLAHNHPGGRLYPSVQDIILTEQVEKLAYSLGFAILDHIILTNDGFYSFVMDGKLKIGK